MGRGNVNRIYLNYNKGVKSTLVFFFFLESYSTS